MAVYCKKCGKEFKDIRTMVHTSGGCFKNGGKEHVLYEGVVGSQYTCKHCGKTYKTLQLMAMHSGRCPKSPNGRCEPYEGH